MACGSGRRARPVTSSFTMFFASSAMVLAFRAGCQARGCARCVCRPRAVRSLKFCSRSGEWPEQRCVPARLGGCNTALLARAATIAAAAQTQTKRVFQRRLATQALERDARSPPPRFILAAKTSEIAQAVTSGHHFELCLGFCPTLSTLASYRGPRDSRRHGSRQGQRTQGEHKTISRER